MKHFTRSLVAMITALFLTSACAMADTSPTTGLPTDKPYQPIMVQYVNTKEGRPLWGLSEADVVYEMIFWGPGHTRYLAIFNDHYADKVGPVRGARISGAELQLAWDCVLIHAGGQQTEGTNIYEFFKAHEVPGWQRVDFIKYGAAGVGFDVDDSRVHPHSRFHHLADWAANEWPIDPETKAPYASQPSGFAYAADIPASDKKVQALSLAYDEEDYQPSYAYDAKGEKWIRSYNGEPQLDGDTNLPVEVQNIIVQVNPLSFWEDNASRPILETTGEGAFLALVGDSRYEGTWTREDMRAQAVYTLKNGEELTLKPGKTFIQMVPPEMFDTMTEEDGAVSFVRQ